MAKHESESTYYIPKYPKRHSWYLSDTFLPLDKVFLIKFVVTGKWHDLLQQHSQFISPESNRLSYQSIIKRNRRIVPPISARIYPPWSAFGDDPFELLLISDVNFSQIGYQGDH